MHGTHLAVCDVLYNKINFRDESTSGIDNDEDANEDNDNELDFLDSGLNILSQNDIIQNMLDLTNEYNICYVPSLLKYHII